jgi:hypothetical protein
MTETVARPPDDAPTSPMEKKLIKKVQQQALEITAYQSHVEWASDFARLCEDHARMVDPTADLTNFVRKVRHCNKYNRICARQP